MKAQPLILMVSLALVAMTTSCKHEPLWNQQNPPQQSASCSPDTAYFQQNVLPVIVSNCALSGCHDDITHKEGLSLTSYGSIMGSGLVVPFQPGNSKLYKVLTADGGDRMPPLPAQQMPQEQMATIYKWIQQGALNNACLSACDSSSYTYTLAIRPLLNNKCAGCHNGASPQGGIDLASYTAVKTRVDDGKLWGSVNHAAGYFAMPKNGAKLSACELGQIRKWIDAGAPEN